MSRGRYRGPSVRRCRHHHHRPAVHPADRPSKTRPARSRRARGGDSYTALASDPGGGGGGGGMCCPPADKQLTPAEDMVRVFTRQVIIAAQRRRAAPRCPEPAVGRSFCMSQISGAASRLAADWMLFVGRVQSGAG